MSEGNCKRRRSCFDVEEKLVGEEEQDGQVQKKKEVSKGRRKTIQLDPAMFKDDSLTFGGCVKARAQVMAQLSKGTGRPPNMSCRVESFRRICQKFDDRRKRWVFEMGFGGLLQLAFDMQLPRQLAYWLMTRIDPINKILITPDGCEFRLSKKQICWVLGIPMGLRTVPSNKSMSSQHREKVQTILMKYGKSWESIGQCGRVYTSVGIPLITTMMDRLEGYFDPSEEEEFKTLFLIVALEMVLCPTQSPRLAADLIPAIGYGMNAIEYDWCVVVLKKLMGSVSSFGRRFYANGFTSGCGGCSLFVVIYYLDRLDKEAVDWDVFPRLKAWNIQYIRTALKLDKLISGDFGMLGVLDVAYGEQHPRDARDSVGPKDDMNLLASAETMSLRIRQRRGRTA